MVRDIRYIIKRVLIGLLIALGVIFFKSKGVFASTTYLNGNMFLYSQSQDCVYDSDTTNIACTKGPSYKSTGIINATNNVAVPILLNTENNDVLFQNAIYDIQLSETLTIDSTYRSPFLLFGFNGPGSGYANGFTMGGSGGSTGLYMTYNQFAISTNEGSKSIPITLGFKPYYCYYHDPDNDTLNTCNLILEMSSNDSGGFKVVLDLSIGTKLDRFVVMFGTPNIYTGSSKQVNTNVRVPNSPTIISSPYTRTYDTWRRNNDTSVGVYYYKKGITFSTAPTLTVPNKSWFIGVDSNVYTSNSYKFNFSNLSIEQITQYQGTIPQIDNELTPSPNTDTFFSDFLEGFTTSSQASGFISLFNNMFLYPLQKLRDNSQVDLVRDNIHGDKILSNYLCMQNSEPGLLGSYIPYKIQFYRDYKFNLPCPHTEIYNKLYYGEYGFYGNDFKGASIRTGISYSFADLWLIIQHGFLVYILFVNCLNVYKYVLDSNKTEVEVLEL